VMILLTILLSDAFKRMRNSKPDSGNESDWNEIAPHDNETYLVESVSRQESHSWTWTSALAVAKPTTSPKVNPAALKPRALSLQNQASEIGSVRSPRTDKTRVTKLTR